MTKYILAIVCCAGLVSSQAFAWGGRGHAAICETATHLVKNPKFKQFLEFRPQMLGHLCNVPDISWKNISKEVSASGSPTHYINPEIIGVSLQDMPTDFPQLIKKYTGTPNKFFEGETIKDIPQELCSLWWRVDQFMRLTETLKPSFAKAQPPMNREQEQDNSIYNQMTYQFMVYIGIMGHFVGDASMPFHNTADHDGWKVDHGGIHFYYEDEVVGQFDGDLHSRVLTSARDLQKSKEMTRLLEGNSIEVMRKLSVLSVSDAANVLKLDPIIKKSIYAKDRNKRKLAERKAPLEGFKVYDKMMVEQMARSSVVLAELWNRAYESVGSPDVSKYQHYRFPFQPDFIPPDYLKTTDVTHPKTAKSE